MNCETKVDLVAPGVWRVGYGTPEKFTPVSTREIAPDLTGMERLPAVCEPPLAVADWRFTPTAAGLRIEIPVGAEPFYGLGLQLKSFQHRGRKKIMRVNSDPSADTGDSHAPVPWLVSASGYGILVDSARYVSFYVASHKPAGSSAQADSAASASVADSTENLYAVRKDSASPLVIFIPAAQGAHLYLFAGPTPRAAVQRYNLFSGGGCQPPLWGLGNWYRCYGKFPQAEALGLAKKLHARGMPLDVFGLEPGWQSRSYACSFVWSKERFPDPARLLGELNALGMRVNLWEHAYVHPQAPFYETMRAHCCDYEVWGGLVPDFLQPQAREAFVKHHEKNVLLPGVSGFKLDECDNSDFVSSPWAFPEHAQFPSGIDGEQMHSLYGRLYQQTMLEIFRQRGTRTYGEARSAHALAAPYPYVLYSDLYDHKEFVRGMTTMGWSGLLWSPEVRWAMSAEDLLRRLQTVIFSPQSLINAWCFEDQPWDVVACNDGVQDKCGLTREELMAACRDLLSLRRSFVPYLYAAFVRYKREGLPPFRPLAMDCSAPEAAEIWDEWLVGDELLVAPLFVGETARDVYLPSGNWRDFNSGQPYCGGQTHRIAADVRSIPIFVRDGATLPLALAVGRLDRQTVFTLTVRCYGESCRPFTLYEDDGESLEFESGASNEIVLQPDTRQLIRTGSCPVRRYEVTEWKAYVASADL